jgi:hypothetical protein
MQRALRVIADFLLWLRISITQALSLSLSHSLSLSLY